jgi:hypothetical protein
MQISRLIPACVAQLAQKRHCGGWRPQKKANHSPGHAFGRSEQIQCYVKGAAALALPSAIRPTLASCPQTFLCVCHAWFYSRQLPAAAAQSSPLGLSACPPASFLRETFCGSLSFRDARPKSSGELAICLAICERTLPPPPDVTCSRNRLAVGNLLAAAVQQVAAAPLMGFLPPAGLERLPSETGNWTLRAKKINNTLLLLRLPGPTLMRVQSHCRAFLPRLITRLQVGNFRQPRVDPMGLKLGGWKWLAYANFLVTKTTLPGFKYF